MIEGLKLNIPQRLAVLKSVLLMSLLIGAMLSFHVWTGNRDFPLVPVWEWAVAPLFVHWILFFLLVFFWIAALLSKFPRLFLFLSLLLSAVLVGMDVNRLQPWFYLYSAMLLVLLFYNGRVDNPNTYTSFFVVLQFVLASVYFFNGFNMLNPDFAQGPYREILLPLKSVLSNRQFSFIVSTGHWVPYLFMISGLLLSIESIRFLAISTMTVIHLVLFVLMFPGVGGESFAMWFSNLSLVCMLFILFSGKIKQRYFSPLALLQRPAFYPVLLIFLVFPFFNRSGFWPDYLSTNIKSGNNLSVKLNISESAYTALPDNIKKFCLHENFSYTIDYVKWSEHEMQVECFPHRMVFRKMNEFILSKTGFAADEVNMVVLPRSGLLF
jgi:hypothetical protein